MSATEVTWDAFDVYIYRLDEAQPQDGSIQQGNAKPDAVTRPSKPYLPPDRGFGHEGFAAISMSHLNATEFCAWLSRVSGKTYRLPTEEEWEWACLQGSSFSYSFGDDAAQLGDHAWFRDNADFVPHSVGAKKPNSLGLFDLHGNVAEWVNGRDGHPVTKGGSYRDAAEKLAATLRVPYDAAWNASDPQIPKSQWWLADAPFIGFRIVCDDVSPSPSVVIPK